MSRAAFLNLLAGAPLTLFRPGLGATARGKSWSRQAAPEVTADRAARLLQQSYVFDGVVNLGVRGEPIPLDQPGAVKRLTGIDAGNYTLRVPILEERKRWVESHPDSLLLIQKKGDLEKARDENRYGVLFYVQSRFDLEGSLEPLHRWKELGLRALQITYFDNPLGGGAGSDDQPLTPFGRQVVKELNRLRIMVDVSHCGRRTTLDVAEVSERPVTANHANLERLTPHRRNKSDRELRAVADAGGVIAITNINRFLLRDPTRPAGIEDFVAHLDGLVQKVGIAHVGISSDSYLDGSQVYEVDYTDASLCSFDRWRHVTRKLLERGYRAADVQKILGLNFQRVYKEVLDA